MSIFFFATYSVFPFFFPVQDEARPSTKSSTPPHNCGRSLIPKLGLVSAPLSDLGLQKSGSWRGCGGSDKSGTAGNIFGGEVIVAINSKLNSVNESVLV